MKKAYELIKSFLSATGMICFGVDLAVIAIFLIVDTFDIDAVMQLELLIGTVVFSAISGGALTFVKKIPHIFPMLRYGLEYIVCLFALYISLFRMTGNGANYTAFFAVATGFTAVYVIIALCAAAIRKILSGKSLFNKKPEKEYENVFDEIKK